MSEHANLTFEMCLRRLIDPFGPCYTRTCPIPLGFCIDATPIFRARVLKLGSHEPRYFPKYPQRFSQISSIIPSPQVKFFSSLKTILADLSNPLMHNYTVSP
ncbi:unnamed protein product, partial [Ixodes pacificus]